MNRNTSLHKDDCRSRVVVTFYRVRKRRIAIHFLLEASVRKLNIMFADGRRFECSRRIRDVPILQRAISSETCEAGPLVNRSRNAVKWFLFRFLPLAHFCSINTNHRGGITIFFCSTITELILLFAAGKFKNELALFRSIKSIYFDSSILSSFLSLTSTFSSIIYFIIQKHMYSDVFGDI